MERGGGKRGRAGGEVRLTWAREPVAPSPEVSFSGRSHVLVTLVLAAQLALQAPTPPPADSGSATPSHALVDSSRALHRPKRVLLLFEYTTQTPAITLIERALRRRLAGDSSGRLEGGDVELFEEHVRLGESESAATTEITYRYLRQKYAHTPPDLVIGVALPHAAVSRLAAGTLVGDVPVILMSSDTAELQAASLAGRSTGIAILPQVSSTVQLLLDLHPRTKHLFVVIGTTDFERALERGVRGRLRRFEDRLDIEYASTMSFPEIVHRAESLAPGSVVLFASMARDARGTRRMSIPSLEQIARVTKVPIYGASSTHVGHGLVGGDVMDFSALGDRAAIQARDVLGGTPPSKIPIDMRAATIHQFDWAQLQRFDIDEKRLPPGSSIVGRVRSPWEQYRWPIFILLVVCALEAALIVALLRQFRQRQAAERAREAYRKLELLLVRLSAQLVAATVTQLDDVAEQVLGQVSEFVSVDRALVAMFDDSGTSLRVIKRWMAPGVPVPTRQLGPEDIPGTWARLRRGERVHIPSLSELPPDLESDRDGYVLLGLKSGLAFPLMAGDRCLGLLAVAAIKHERAWDPDVIDGLSVLAHMLSSALVRRRAELEVAQRRDELSHLARVGIVGELSASLAHEINQPLGAIILSVQAAQRWLASGRPEPREVGRLLERVSTDVQRAYTIIDRLRRLLRKQPSDLKEIQLEELVAGVVALLHGDALRRRVTLTHASAAQVPSVKGDHIQLEQVVVNLILNAFDSIVAADARERHVRVFVETAAHNEVVVSVVDSGNGIPPEQLQSIFEPFVTSKRDGIGMGLAICRMIVEAHGGRIWAENAQGGGARVAFALSSLPTPPVAERRPERQARPVESPPYLSPPPRQAMAPTKDSPRATL